MKKIRKIGCLFLASCMLISACSPNAKGNNSKSDITIKVALATEKYTQDADISSLSEGTLRIAAAKGETEGAQFIVNAKKDINSYDFTISDLKSDSHTIEASAINVQAELYSHASANTYSTSLPTGSYPDALIPTDYIVEAGENKIQAKKNQAFFVDIKVPEDATAGIYEGKIVMDCAGKEMEIPVELEVYDFVISQVPYTKTCYLIWQDWLIYGEFDTSDDKYMDYYDVMLDYNICAYTFPHTTAEEFVGYVREYYSRISCYGIPYNPVTMTENDWGKYLEYMMGLAKAAVEDGVNYFDKAYYYFDIFYDEYDAIDWRASAMGQILTNCDAKEEELISSLVKQKMIPSANCEMAETIRTLQHVIPGGSYDEKWADYDVNHCIIGTSLINSVAMENYKNTLTEEEDFWWYQAIQNISFPMPDKSINGYSISQRDHFWSNYEYGIEGDLFWNVTGYCNWQAYDSFNQYQVLDDLYTTASHDTISNGDGYLMYPGFGYGSEKPFASLRMVQIRDGIDDNTYMGMLGDTYANLSSVYNTDTKDAKELVSFINKHIVTRQVSQLNEQKLADGRDALAKAIVLANKQGVVIDELSVEQNELTYTIYADADTELEVNGKAVTSETAGEGKCFKGTITLDKSGKLVLDFKKDGKTETMELWTASEGVAVNNFDTDAEIKECNVYSNYGSSVQLNSNAQYAKSGNSVKARLTGHDFGRSDHNEQYIPKITFSTEKSGKKMSEVESIEFWVYNPQSKDVAVEAFLEGVTEEGEKVSYVYDKIYLYANSWTKVTIDNFNYISRVPEDRDVYTDVGIRTITNHIGTTYEFYVDELFVR